MSPNTATGRCDYRACRRPATVALRFGDGTYAYGRAELRQSPVGYCAEHFAIVDRLFRVCDVAPLNGGGLAVELANAGQSSRARTAVQPVEGDWPALQELASAVDVPMVELEAILRRVTPRRAVQILIRMLERRAAAAGVAA